MSDSPIVIVDYGMGNLGSIRNMLKKLGFASAISADPSVVGAADKLILPGVGRFDRGMANLASTGLKAALDRRVLEDAVPILGICLGMQLLTQESEEGNVAGLGWIDAATRRFRFEGGDIVRKVPHMGWNYVRQRKSSAVFADLKGENRFYFVHSYHVACSSPEDVLMTTEYGTPFTSAVERDNIVGVQFHPEKSHRFGMGLLRQFALWNR